MRHILTILFVALSVTLSAQDWAWNNWDLKPAEEPVLRQYTEFTVKEGYDLYIPILPDVYYRYKDLSKVEWSVMFDQSSEYDWSGDGDQMDWNQGGGISLSDKDYLSWVWRWNEDSSRYEFSVNRVWNAKSKDYEPLKFAASGDITDIAFVGVDNNKWKVVISDANTGESGSITVKVRKNPKWARPLPPVFGRINDEAGRFGGVASQDMTMWIWRNSINQK